jgi:photosystem II stability/assembly factor-like uncharacterized protein
MGKRVLLLVGTKRGLFLLTSDPARRAWQIEGPLANSGWAFGHACYDPDSGTLFAAGQNAWFGAAVWRSPDLGRTWTLSSEGLTYGDEGPAIRSIWQLKPARGKLYAGVDPAGLFVSADGGQNWSPVSRPLSELPQASAWQPGKGGLPVHSIVPDPAGPGRWWIGLAGGGVLYTGDGGDTWEARNPSLPGAAPFRSQKLLAAPGGSGLLYQQHHAGVFRSADGGRTWLDITAGLPTRFGFGLALHPRDPDSLYTVPITNANGSRHFPDGRIAVWRSRNGGQSWIRLTGGLPETPAFVSVLREGLATDSLEPAGVYFGTTGGHLLASNDEGETWTSPAPHLPEILSVTAAVLEE